MATETSANQYPRYSCFRDDIECKLGLRGGQFTRVNSFLWLTVAAVLTAITYGILSFFPENPYVEIFTERSWVQHTNVLFSYWSLLILLLKWHKTRLQRRVLEFQDLVPPAADFVLSPATVNQVLRRMQDECDDPSRFILLNRIHLALRNLKNMGQIGDVDDVLQSHADGDEAVMESSYSLVKGLIWAIPVLGFIGTVQGLSVAIGEFGNTLNTTAEIGQLKQSLQGVTAGLSVAFDTTFVALIMALIIQLLLTAVRKSEEELLDECRNYCQRHVVSRLRLMPFSVAE